MKFGEIVRAKRLEKQIGLRQFCLETGVDPSNWSRIERGLQPPPNTFDFEKVATLLDINSDALKDLAKLAANQIPPSIAQNESIMSMLPAFFCTHSGQRPTKAEIEEFIDGLKELGYKE